MIGESLMQRIYEGAFPKDLFDSFAPFPHSEKADRVIEGYRQLLQEFPPEALEAEGRLPPEMLQEMAGIGLFGLSIPVAYGGLGFDTREYMRVVEGMVAPGHGRRSRFPRPSGHRGEGHRTLR